MKAAAIRESFLKSFESHQHVILPSSPVVPVGDPTLLFTNAGMNQFKDIFTGKVKPKQPRAATVQKCIRAGGKHNDLDNVGYTTRHLTFFEMLGNFSFGDYFKKEAIEFAWELVTQKFELPVERLWVTVYRDDEEARELWRQVASLPDDRIVGLGEKDNYWSMGDVGPCGPCSEILFDRGETFGEADIENGERFFEFWNLVFMQFDQQPGGEKVPLPRPSIDTGMGLERIAMVKQDAHSVFDIDLFMRLIRKVEEVTGCKYNPGPKGVPHRVIADHIRALVFAFSDGAEPSNEGRGYVLRRILRRAARYARKLTERGTILPQLVDDVVGEMGDAYPEIRAHRDLVSNVIENEEVRFGETLDTGIELFEGIAARLAETGEKIVSGDDAFKLYDTFGFPVDLVERMAEEKGMSVDMERFEELMERQKDRSRQGAAFVHTGGELDIDLGALPETRFVGYESTTGEGEIQVAAQGEDGIWRVVVSDTPFYGESGGQVGDCGVLEGENFQLTVEDTQKDEGRFVHYCQLVEGDPALVRSGAVVRGSVDAIRRAAIERNHSATHLVHAALRQVAGDKVRQKGSLVHPERLRFDVSHYGAFTREQLLEVEDIVRREVLRDTPVETFETDFEDARKRGALAFFGEKYGDLVRVVRMGDFSMELCGGTHVGRTGEIGAFLLVGEGSVSSGVRRIEALTAAAAETAHRANQELLEEISRRLKSPVDSVVDRLEKLIKENRDLKARLKQQVPAAGDSEVRREKLGDSLFVAAQVSAGGKELRDLSDTFKRESPQTVAVLFGVGGDKTAVLVAVTRSLVEKGVDAREVFAAMGETLGLRGGGRPEMAQGGGAVEGSQIPEAVQRALETVKAALG